MCLKLTWVYSDIGYTDFRFIEQYVHQYCWNSGLVDNPNGTCSGTGAVNWIDSDIRVDNRRVIDDFPKWIAFFAVLYTLPHYYWEYFCGGTLAGYLAHLKYLIDAIKTKCENVPDKATFGNREMTAASVFDANSKTFATRETYTRMWVNDQFQNGATS